MLFTNFWTDWQLTRRLRNSITLLNFMLSQSLWNMNIYIIRFLQMWEVHFYTNTGHLILMLNLHSLTRYSGFFSESLDLLSAKVFYAITEPQSNIINLSPCCTYKRTVFSSMCLKSSCLGWAHHFNLIILYPGLNVVWGRAGHWHFQACSKHVNVINTHCIEFN